MIFYYTSTGNSQWVAEKLEHLLEESLFSINAIAKEGFNACDYEFEEGERLIIVFPVHSWNVPSTVVNFLNKFTYEGKPRSVYAICTCGDDCGYTNRQLEKILAQNNLKLDACFSIQMPNDYVLFPGFDIDVEEIQQKKMVAAVEKVKQYAEDIRNNVTDATNRYTYGSMPWIKTMVIYPFFEHFQCGRTPFMANDNCVRCGLCAQMCPVNNIRIQSDGSPQWRNHCTQCTACFHHCPKNAVQYGRRTIGKGQYLNSHVKFDD